MIISTWEPVNLIKRDRTWPECPICVVWLEKSAKISEKKCLQEIETELPIRKTVGERGVCVCVRAWYFKSFLLSLGLILESFISLGLIGIL